MECLSGDEGVASSYPSAVATAPPQTRATANSPLFTKLLPELRELILKEAFGGRKLHIHRYPWSAEREGVRDGTRYFGCVCHYCSEGSSGDIDPGQCDCLEHEVCGCGYDNDDESHNCAIGALGWLLSCRQAFAEGIEAIYTTNTIQIRGGTVDSGLIYHVPVPYLQQVRSLEWILDPRFPGLGQSSSTQCEQDSLQRLLCDLPKVLPNLQKLYIGFLGHLCFWDTYPESPKERFIIYTDHILPSLDHMAWELGADLKEMEVGLPTSVFQPHFHQGLERGFKFQVPNLPPGKLSHGDLYPRDRVWRLIQKTENGSRTKLAKDQGYWLSETSYDMPDSWMLTMSRFWE